MDVDELCDKAKAGGPGCIVSSGGNGSVGCIMELICLEIRITSYP